MKRLFKLTSISSTSIFIKFVLAMTLISIFGGYQLSKLVYNMNEYSLQSTDQLLVIEENLDEVAISLGKQIQEWKDMLLRIDDKDLFDKHHKAFQASAVGVQTSLYKAKIKMQRIGLDTNAIDQLMNEHKILVTNYQSAFSKLKLGDIESANAVDKQIIGVDRELQQHIVLIKEDIAYQAKQQLNGDMPALGKRYMLVGLLGTISLLIMSLVGFIFVTGFENHEPKTN